LSGVGKERKFGVLREDFLPEEERRRWSTLKKEL
jgi:hypothetical protein